MHKKMIWFLLGLARYIFERICLITAYTDILGNVLSWLWAMLCAWYKQPYNIKYSNFCLCVGG